jgi:predicted membrane channel-forming protein YqfA (hemolysin III family)
MHPILLAHRRKAEWMKHIRKRAGYRGAALLLIGILWCLTGAGVIVAPLKRAELIDESLPIQLRIFLWMGPGLLALVAAVWRKYDPLAWGWLIVPAVVRFVSFTFGWFCSLVGWERWSYPEGWRGATSTAVFVALLIVCAKGLDRPLAPATPSEA